MGEHLKVDFTLFVLFFPSGMKRKRMRTNDTSNLSDEETGDRVAFLTRPGVGDQHTGLTQEILVMELADDCTPKRKAMHLSPTAVNPLKGVLKKRYVYT